MPKGKIITFISGKGGVGKTVLATNLAVFFSRENKKKVCLVDMGFHFGEDIAGLLNIIADALLSAIKLDIIPIPLVKSLSNWLTSKTIKHPQLHVKCAMKT